MRDEKFRASLKAKYPHVTERELDEAEANLDLFGRMVLNALEVQSDRRKVPHNLPTESDSTL